MIYQLLGRWIWLLLKSVRSKAKKSKKSIDIAEAFFLWDLLATKYYELEKFLIWDNYVHDWDLQKLIEHFQTSIQKRVKVLENKLEDYAIQGPLPNVKGVNTASNSEVIRDEYIARDTYMLLQEALGLLCKGVIDSTTNEEVRGFIKDTVVEVANNLDRFVKFLKLKGWIEIPPLYPNIPSEVEERLDVGEAYSLWSHLAFRYDHLNETEVALEFAYDQDFKLLLKRGHGMLKRQIKALEKSLLHFGLPLPKPTTEVLSPPEATEIMKDRKLFHTIWLGVQSAVVIHYTAVKRSVMNDHIRREFIQLLFEELDTFDQLIRYGKLKDWLYTTPRYTLFK